MKTIYKNLITIELDEQELSDLIDDAGSVEVVETINGEPVKVIIKKYNG